MMMRSPEGRDVFRNFLRSEYSEENLMFWISCEELKKETNPSVIDEKARIIYEDYVSILSPKEVRLWGASKINNAVCGCNASKFLSRKVCSLSGHICNASRQLILLWVFVLCST